jgi:Uma2 family endonuclease
MASVSESAMPATMTAEEFASCADLPEFCELVRGKVTQMNVPGSRHGEVCCELAYWLKHHCLANDCGRVLVNDSGVVTGREPDTVRGADIAYYSFDRLPRGPAPKGYPQAVPELVAEVMSPGDRWPSVMVKVAEYLQAGVNIVLVLNTEAATVRVFDVNGGIALLDDSQQLTLAGVLPGFSVPVAKIFG